MEEVRTCGAWIWAYVRLGGTVVMWKNGVVVQCYDNARWQPTARCQRRLDVVVEEEADAAGAGEARKKREKYRERFDGGG